MPSELRPILCGHCGAPVPLAPISPTRCAHCGTQVALPSFHVDLLAKTLRANEQMKAAEELWRSMPRAMPSWLAPVFVVAIVLVVLASTLFWAFAAMPLMGHPGRTFALFAFAPSLVALYAGLELLAFWAPFAKLEATFSATRDPKFPEVALCRRCGSPLSVAPESIAVRCPFCESDNLLRTLRLQAFRQARELATEGRARIDEAIAALRMLRMQRSVVRWVGIPMIGGLILLMTIVLWNR